MTYRELPFDEWHKLDNHPFFNNKPLPSPAHAWIVVAEDANGVIKGFQISQAVIHTEPVYIDEDVRSGLVGANLFKHTRQSLDTRNIPEAYCFAASSETADYLTRLKCEVLPYLIFSLCPASSDLDDPKKKKTPSGVKTLPLPPKATSPNS